VYLLLLASVTLAYRKIEDNKNLNYTFMSDDEVYSPAVPSEQIESMPDEESEPLERPQGKRKRTEKQKLVFEKARLKRLENIRQKNKRQNRYK